MPHLHRRCHHNLIGRLDSNRSAWGAGLRVRWGGSRRRLLGEILRALPGGGKAPPRESQRGPRGAPIGERAVNNPRAKAVPAPPFLLGGESGKEKRFPRARGRAGSAFPT